MWCKFIFLLCSLEFDNVLIDDSWKYNHQVLFLDYVVRVNSTQEMINIHWSPAICKNLLPIAYHPCNLCCCWSLINLNDFVILLHFQLTSISLTQLHNTGNTFGRVCPLPTIFSNLQRGSEFMLGSPFTTISDASKFPACRWNSPTFAPRRLIWWIGVIEWDCQKKVS